MKKYAFLLGLAVVAAATQIQAAPKVPVVAGAQALTTAEKTDVTGRCGCPTKPGYGFGTDGHYGPPGLGYTTHDNWRKHAGSDGVSPTGQPLPPVAFTK
jgi:hypothetical protein